MAVDPSGRNKINCQSEIYLKADSVVKKNA
jgi:hypothetical protein